MTAFFEKNLRIFLLSLFFFSNSCRDKVDLPSIGLNTANPIAVSSDTSGNYFYVLNADFLHKYESGSLLVLDKDGTKLTAIPTPRLGKVLHVSGKNLFILFDREDTEQTAQQRQESSSLGMLFDLSSPEKPRLLKEFHLQGCTPANVASRVGYGYFAIACNEGHLWMGTLAGENSSIKKVREYPSLNGGVRRAMYLDPKRELLFSFMSDMTNGDLVDKLETDNETWNDRTKVEGPDEIPDALQQTAGRAADILKNTSRFQFLVYDIAEAKAASFPFKDFKDVQKSEPRWLYFDLRNSDLAADDPAAQGDATIKYYRTNFWETQPDPDSDDSFYISHRGLGGIGRSEHSNDIIKVTFKGGDPRAKAGDYPPKLESYLSFDRVYGFKGDETGADKYMNSFIITKYQGQKIVLLNSFRDLVNFSNPRYMLAAANVIEPGTPYGTWFAQVSSNKVEDSYYQLALANNGNLLSSSFFDGSLRLFKVRFGDTISLIRSIN